MRRWPHSAAPHIGALQSALLLALLYSPDHTPEDVASAMLFLASGMAGFITGAALPVEGGATIALKF